MEIIHLILGKANPNRMNGVNKVVYQLASKQASSGRHVAVWGITKHVTHNYGPRNFATVLFPAKRNPFALDAALKQTILTKKGKAIFHLHGGWIPTYASISKFLNKVKIPFVLTPHGAYNSIAMQRSKWLKRIYFLLFEKTLLTQVQKIHSIGESEVTGLQQIFPNNKSILLPYGFETNQINSKNTKEESDFIIGFVGRLDIYTKGLDILLNSFQQFQKLAPNTKLWIIGDSDERPKLEELIQDKNLGEKVILWGSKFGLEKDKLMRQMHIFVHPSRNEGLPSSVLEACNMGIPCVVSKATNMTTYISEMNAGLAIENDDEDGLTKAFHTLYDLKKGNKLDELAVNAKRMVQRTFNWDTIVEKFDHLYR